MKYIQAFLFGCLMGSLVAAGLACQDPKVPDDKAGVAAEYQVDLMVCYSSAKSMEEYNRCADQVQKCAKSAADTTQYRTCKDGK